MDQICKINDLYMLCKGAIHKPCTLIYFWTFLTPWIFGNPPFPWHDPKEILLLNIIFHFAKSSQITKWFYKLINNGNNKLLEEKYPAPFNKPIYHFCLQKCTEPHCEDLTLLNNFEWKNKETTKFFFKNVIPIWEKVGQF